MFLASNVVPFFMTWYVSSSAALKVFHAFACGGSSCLLASLLAPSPPLGLGVRGGSLNIFHLGLLGSTDPYCLLCDGKCKLFFLRFWIILFETYSPLSPNIYFYFSLVVSCPPHLK
jgi:hypothetical protein